MNSTKVHRTGVRTSPLERSEQARKKVDIFGGGPFLYCGALYVGQTSGSSVNWEGTLTRETCKAWYGFLDNRYKKGNSPSIPFMLRKHPKSIKHECLGRIVRQPTQ